MKHVFVESNWVVDVCAPSFRRTPDALALLARADAGEIQLHVPSIALREARSVIRVKHQPREAALLQQFRRWARRSGALVEEDDRAVNEFLQKFTNEVSAELTRLEARVQELVQAKGLEVFSLSEAMLDRALSLRDEVPDPPLKPFDEAILAGVLVRASELVGEEPRLFCTMDRDLSPVDKHGTRRPYLQKLYDEVGLDVRTRFLVD